MYEENKITQREKLQEPERNSAAEKTVTKMENTQGGSKVAFIKQKEKNKQT